MASFAIHLRDSVHVAWIGDRFFDALTHDVDPLFVEQTAQADSAVALEAQGFAYLAMRSRLGLPLSLPTTTGVQQPMTGGRFYRAP